MKALIAMCIGGASAAVVLSLMCYRLPSTRMVIAINGGVCGLLAALTTYTYPHSHTMLTSLATGFLSTAAPLTSVFLRYPAIETISEAIQFASRVAGVLALNLVYGAAFALIGFLGVLFIATPAPG